MGFLDKIFRRGGGSAASEQRIPPAPIVSAEQEKMNRDLMEAEMAQSKEKREEEK